MSGQLQAHTQSSLSWPAASLKHKAGEQQALMELLMLKACPFMLKSTQAFEDLA